MNRIFLLVSVILLLTGPLGSAGATTLSLVTLESPPVEFTQNGKTMGRNLDIVRECLRRMGFDCQVSVIPWKRALLMVENGSADGIIDAAYTEERAAFLYYPDEPLYIERWYGFRKTGSTVSFDRGLTNAGEYALGVAMGFECGGIIQEAVDQGWFKAIHLAVSNEMNIHKLMAGRFDAFIGVGVTIAYYAKQMGLSGQLERVPMTETGTPYLLSDSKTYLAFSKKTMTPEIVEVFSQTLKEMKDDGTVDRLSSAYR